MSKTDELTLMKRAALRAVVANAVKTGSVKLTKTAAEQRLRMATFLKQGGVKGHEVMALCRSVKMAALMPSDRAFEKVAKVACMDVRTVKLAYMSKVGLIGQLAGGLSGGLAGKAIGGPLGALAGAGLGYMAGGALEKAPDQLSHAMNPYQMSPERRFLYQRIQNEALGNQRLSQDLQAMQGAFRPAGNPWGPGQAH